MEHFINLLNLPIETIAEVTRTGDGYFLARPYGSIGFDIFLGVPNSGPGPGRDRSRSVFRSLTFAEKREAIRTSKRFAFNLRSFLGKGD